MNVLIVGSDKAPILHYVPERDFLIIDDGPIIDQLHRRARHFDAAAHSFNPLKEIDHLKAREFVAVLDAAFPRGDGTLTKDTGLGFIFRALLADPHSLVDLIPIPDRKSPPGHIWAYDKIQELLHSPVLRRVLTRAARPVDLSLRGTIIARLDRAELGDFDAFVLGNLLISQYRGTVVIPDFRFYACGFHTSLIRQERLIAGIGSFDELPDLRSDLLLIQKKVPSSCTPDDAKILAAYEGLRPDLTREDSPYNRFIDRATGAA